jgi:coenzyme F420-reducing hydrogenase beta subunit
MNLNDIVKSGYCIGCGACCSVQGSNLKMAFDEHGQYKPSVSDTAPLEAAAHQKALEICPFSDHGPNEDQIGESLYGSSNKHHSMLGYYGELYIGHARAGGIREIATSGGIITWVLCKLLESKEVDGIIHVQSFPNAADGVLFRYGISRTVSEVRAGAKSRYYPIETSQVLELVRSQPGRYVFVGIPCFVKAIRRLCRVDPVFGASIRFTVGLVCGHLKSKSFADLFAWQAGITPGRLERIDFRVKRDEGDSQDYAVAVSGEGKQATRSHRTYFGTNWGYNFFRNSACDYCDDVFAEAADLSVGDAWLPEYRNDPRGNSLVVVRHQVLRDLVREGIQSGELALVDSDPSRFIASQSGGFRDRREALSYRLWLDIEAGRPVPKKRVTPDPGNFPFYRRMIYRNRITLRKKSHTEWARAVRLNSLGYFKMAMAPWMLANNMLYKYPAFLRSLFPWLFPKKKA